MLSKQAQDAIVDIIHGDIEEEVEVFYEYDVSRDHDPFMLGNIEHHTAKITVRRQSVARAGESDSVL